MIFEEEFPSLKEFKVCTNECFITKCTTDDTHNVCCTHIKRYCLDKQRVKEAIDFIRIKECDKHNEYILETLIKELGLK